jgi:hypothetical protein
MSSQISICFLNSDRARAPRHAHTHTHTDIEWCMKWCLIESWNRNFNIHIIMCIYPQTEWTIHGDLFCMDYMLNMTTVLLCNFQNADGYIHDHLPAYILHNFTTQSNNQSPELHYWGWSFWKQFFVRVTPKELAPEDCVWAIGWPFQFIPMTRI